MSESTQPRIVIAEPFRPDIVDRLRRIGTVVELTDSTPAKLLDAVKDADALLVRMRSHVTARIIEAAPRLRVIGRAGASLDHIDIRAAQRRQVTVVHTPEAAVNSTAEYTVGLILAATRRICWYDRRIREGQFDALRASHGREIRHMVIGLLGCGPVADEVSRILHRGFGANLIAFTPTGEDCPGDARSVARDELLRESDVISLHALPSDRTRLIGQAELDAMKPSAYIVNTSRGSALDDRALAEALKTHRIAGAALDVYEAEPLATDHPLRTAPNCILSPHVAAATQDVADSHFGVAEDVIRVLRGEAPHYPARTERKTPTWPAPQASEAAPAQG